MDVKKTYKKIRRKLETLLDEERFDHTLGVAKTAQFLAKIYDYDSDKAYLAGLLHDCAKNIPTKEKIKMCKDKNVIISDVELENPSLLHAKCGAIVANVEFDIEDEDILNAIRFHTTGRPNMSILEKIVFVSDYIEPGRIERFNMNNIRKESLSNLDLSVFLILEDTLKYLSDTAKAIDNTTKETYLYYKKELNL